MCQVGRDFEADETVLSIGRVVDRAEYVGDCANILDDQGFVDFIGTLALSDKLVNLLIVGVTGANRLLENGGVGGDATDAVLVQQTLELAGNEL